MGSFLVSNFSRCVTKTALSCRAMIASAKKKKNDYHLRHFLAPPAFAAL
jgi:hypothetical protein